MEKSDQRRQEADKLQWSEKKKQLLLHQKYIKLRMYKTIVVMNYQKWQEEVFKENIFYYYVIR